MEKEDFLRIIYWHCRFNDFIDTVYQADGTAYAALKELDAGKVILKIQDYAKELSYAEYSRKEIERLKKRRPESLKIAYNNDMKWLMMTGLMFLAVFLQRMSRYNSHVSEPQKK